MGEEKKKPSSLRKRMERPPARRARQAYRRKLNPVPVVIGAVVLAVVGVGLLLASRGGPTRETEKIGPPEAEAVPDEPREPGPVQAEAPAQELEEVAPPRPTSPAEVEKRAEEEELVPPPPPLEGRPVEVTIETGETYQTIEGFGAFCHITPAPKTEKWGGGTPKFYDMLVFDLGTSLVRTGVAYNMEPVNDDDDPNHINWAGFDLGQMVPQMETLHEFQKRGVTRFTASLWSPPEFMKTHRAIIQGGKLRPDMRDELAEYLVAYLTAAREKWGVDIYSLSIQNELLFLEFYMSCIYSPAQIREAVRAVMRKFKREGIRTRIMTPEDMMFPDRMVWYVKPTMADPETRDFPGFFCTHRKGGFDDWRKFWKFIEPFGRQIWMTETGGGRKDWKGAVQSASAIHDALVGGNASAWLFWTFKSIIEGEKPKVGYWPAKHYYRFVRPGAVRVDARTQDPNLLVSAFKHPEGDAITVVLINRATDAAGVTIRVKDAAPPESYRVYLSDEDQKWARKGRISGPALLRLSMPPNSIVTIQSGEEDDLRTGLRPNAILKPPKPDIKRSRYPRDWTHICRGAELGIVNWVKNDLKKVSVDARNPNGWRPLHRATLWGRDNQRNMIRLLLERGADVNAPATDGWTPMHMAAATYVKDPVRILKLFMEKGGDVHAKTKDGWTPLTSAVANAWVGYKYDPRWAPERVRLLLEAGAKVDEPDIKGRTPLHWAAWVGFLRRPRVVSTVADILIEAGADVNARDKSGRTPLHYAAMEGYEAIVNSLVAAGADANAKDREGRTPADIAGAREFSGILALLAGKKVATKPVRPPDLRAKGPLASRTRPGVSPGRFGNEIRTAAAGGDLRAVQNLLVRGADPNAASDGRRRTPLHLAAEAGHVEVVKALVAAGADVSAQDSDGITPAERARDNGHQEVVAILRRAAGE